jgi:predicted nucleic acid-binding protein
VIVLSDSSPLINLAKLGRLDLLPALYKTVTVTHEVYAEVVVNGAGMAGSSQISGAAWIDVRNVAKHSDLSAARQRVGLGVGELSVIILAQELRADLLLVDDRDARRAARQEGLAVLGCVGILHEPFDQELLSDLRDCYLRLLASGAYIDPRLLDGILTSRNLPPI